MIWFAYPAVLFGGMLLIVLVFAYSLWKSREPSLEWPYVSLVKKLMTQTFHRWSPKRVIRVLRIFSIVSVLLATARPQCADEDARLPVEGRDIMLVVDVSGSMQLFDDEKDHTTRFEAAKKEVLSFIDQRKDDQMGLVLFAATAFSRCPLTYDKTLLTKLVTDLQLGMINPDGTVLSAALAVAVNRLRSSHARTKVIIVLTDGAPSEYDVSPDDVIALAKQYGIKIYTIGVGSETGGFALVPFHGLIRCQTPLNVSLLQRYAQETNGAFFRAENAEEIARVYKTIDSLEKSSYEVPRYIRYKELFPWFAWAALLALIFELFLCAWWVVA